MRAASGSSRPGRPALTRFKLTPDGVLFKEAVGGGWILTTPRVDLARLDATTDADIHHQRIAELVDEALQASMSSVAQLAKALHLSPSTIRCWRRGAVSPTAGELAQAGGEAWSQALSPVVFWLQNRENPAKIESAASAIP